jgi:hypothetical protein
LRKESALDSVVSQFPNCQPHTRGAGSMAEMLGERMGLFSSTEHSTGVADPRGMRPTASARVLRIITRTARQRFCFFLDGN